MVQHAVRGQTPVHASKPSALHFPIPSHRLGIAGVIAEKARWPTCNDVEKAREALSDKGVRSGLPKGCKQNAEKSWDGWGRQCGSGGRALQGYVTLRIALSFLGCAAKTDDVELNQAKSGLAGTA